MSLWEVVLDQAVKKFCGGDFQRTSVSHLTDDFHLTAN